MDEFINVPNLTRRGHGSKGEATFLNIKGEELEVQLAGGGQHVAWSCVNPAIGWDGGQRALIATGSIRDAVGTRWGEIKNTEEEKHLFCTLIQNSVHMNVVLKSRLP